MMLEIIRLASVAKDDVAANKLAQRELSEGRCYVFEPSEWVYVEDTARAGSRVKLRVKGATQGFWAYADAVER